MQFEFKNDTNVEFCELIPKDVFVGNTCVFMKIVNCSIDGDLKNCIRFSDGLLHFFEEDRVVEKVNATLVMT